MKSALVAVLLLGSLASEARSPKVKIEIKREPASHTEVNGFTESLYGRTAKTCFSGSPNAVCTAVKSLVGRANNDLSLAGAGQRFDVVSCAQNPTRTMVIYSVRPARELAKINPRKTQKTVFIERCGGSEPQQVAFSLLNQ